jgi:hypothetical protein
MKKPQPLKSPESIADLKRKCRAIEISPAYCAVVLQRMADAFPGIEIEKLPG